MRYTKKREGLESSPPAITTNKFNTHLFILMKLIHFEEENPAYGLKLISRLAW